MFFTGEEKPVVISEDMVKSMYSNSRYKKGDVVENNFDSLKKEKTSIWIKIDKERIEMFRYEGDMHVVSSRLWASSQLRHFYDVIIRKGTRVIPGINEDLPEKMEIITIYN